MYLNNVVQNTARKIYILELSINITLQKKAPSIIDIRNYIAHTEPICKNYKL